MPPKHIAGAVAAGIMIVGALFLAANGGVFSLTDVSLGHTIEAQSCTSSGGDFTCSSAVNPVDGDNLGGTYVLDIGHEVGDVPAVGDAYTEAGYDVNDRQQLVNPGNVSGTCTIKNWKQTWSTLNTGTVTISFKGSGEIVNGVQCKLNEGTYTCESGDCGFDTVALDNINQPDDQDRFKINDLLGNAQSGYTSTYRLDDAQPGEPNITLTTGETAVENTTVATAFTVTNTGGADMAETWIVEQQVGSSGTFALSSLSRQQVCDASNPATVHRSFTLAAGESVSGTLSSELSINRKGETVPVRVVVAPSCNRSRYLAVRDIGSVFIQPQIQQAGSTNKGTEESGTQQEAEAAADVPDTVWAVSGDECFTMGGVEAVEQGRNWFDSRDACRSTTASTQVPSEQPGLAGQISGFFAGLLDLLTFWS